MDPKVTNCPSLNNRRRWRLYAAGLTLMGITFVTLSPLKLKPRTGHPNTERFIAFALLGALAETAFPKRPRLALLGVCAVAVGLEWAQHLSPTRHARVADALAKTAGGVVGFGLAAAAAKLNWAQPAKRRSRGRGFQCR